MVVIFFTAAAGRAGVADDAVVAADRIAVDRVVDRAVADAAFGHEPDDFFEGLKVLRGVAVHLDIGDVAGIGQRVVGRFDADLVKGADLELDRDMEAVGVVFLVGDARSVCRSACGRCLQETAGQSLGRRRQQGEIETGLLRICDRRKSRRWLTISRPELLRFGALAVMAAGQRRPAFRPGR